jgi:hypothetical protein
MPLTWFCEYDFEYACVGVFFGIACRGHKMCYLSRFTELGSGFCVCFSVSYVWLKFRVIGT